MTPAKLQKLKREGKIQGWAEKGRNEAVVKPQGQDAPTAAPRKKPGQQESHLQQNIIRTFRLMYPDYAPYLFAIPNGGHRSKATAARMKAEGARSGVWDMQFTVPVGRWAGMWIEVKTKTGRLSPEQLEFFNQHRHTHFMRVVRSVDQFLNEFRDYLNQ